MSPRPDDGGTYRDQNFVRLQLTGTLVGATFHDCVFEGCDLHEVRLNGCRFVDTDFLTCDLGLVVVADSAFQGVTIENTQAVGVNWSSARVDLNHPLEIDFKDSILNFATFDGLHLRRRRFEGCTVHEALFARCDLTDASFRGSDLSGTEFRTCDLSGADLRKARGYQIDVRHNAVRGLHVWMPEASGLLHGLGVDLDTDGVDEGAGAAR